MKTPTQVKFGIVPKPVAQAPLSVPLGASRSAPLPGRSLTLGSNEVGFDEDDEDNIMYVEMDDADELERKKYSVSLSIHSQVDDPDRSGGSREG